MPISVIGVAGGAGVGKDYIVKQYLEPRGYKGVAFADHFKTTLIGRGALTFDEAHTNPKPEAVRKRLIEEGDGGRATFGDDVWVDTLFADLQRLEMRFGLSRFVLTDCRRVNEVQAIQRHGGKVVLIHAPTRWATNGMPEDVRASNTEQFARETDTFVSLFDAVLFNDPEHAPTVGDQMNRILGDFGVPTVLDARIRLGVSEAIKALEARPAVTKMTGGLQPLCLTCGPKNISWMGPTVQLCARCQAEFDRWQSTTTVSTS